MTSRLHDLRFGPARISFHDGNPLEFSSEALYVSVNARGILASGLAGAVRLAAGAEIERELRSYGDLLEGTAYVLGPWGLAHRGIARVVCGVTTSAPGQPPKRAHVTDAIAMAFELLAEAGTGSVTLPEIGTRIPGITLNDAAGILSTALTSALRRPTRLTRIAIAGLHHEYLSACHDRLLRSGASLD